MKRKILYFVSALCLMSLSIYGGAVSNVAHAAPLAFPGWEDMNCVNVLKSERGLWLDTAGAVSEAGLFWLKANDTLNETCSITSYFPDYVSSNTFPILEMRVAVNDGARLTVTVYEDGFEFCSKVMVASITSSSTEDNSAYRLKKITLPPNITSLCAVTITIDDDPDAVKSSRANALIDYIRIWDGTNIGWEETFKDGSP